MDAREIRECLRGLTGHGVFVPEFTYGDLRIDALLVDTRHRWVRGFEIKTRREDFLRDRKWTLYSQFCSSLSIACPEGLLTREDVGHPFGLLWVRQNGEVLKPVWVRRPANLQHRGSLAWLWAYTHILELELPRLDGANAHLLTEVQRLWSMLPAADRATLGRP